MRAESNPSRWPQRRCPVHARKSSPDTLKRWRSCGRRFSTHRKIRLPRPTRWRLCRWRTGHQCGANSGLRGLYRGARTVSGCHCARSAGRLHSPRIDRHPRPFSASAGDGRSWLFTAGLARTGGFARRGEYGGCGACPRGGAGIRAWTDLPWDYDRACVRRALCRGNGGIVRSSVEARITTRKRDGTFRPHATARTAPDT